MTLKRKRILAARKAVNTLRLNLLEQADFDEVKKLSKEIRQKEFAIDDDFSKISVIAKEIAPTTWKSFCRYGDRKCATPGLILYWINNDGMSLDEQAMWIEETHNLHLLPEELADFMIDHDRGKMLYKPYAELNNLYRIFKEMTGFNYNHKFVKDNILLPQTAETQMPF